MLFRKTMNVGAVGALRRVKNVISVARHVLEHTKHSFLVGDQATKFALQMGFREETLTTPDSKKVWMKWNNEDNCQPNFWTVRIFILSYNPSAKQMASLVLFQIFVAIVDHSLKNLSRFSCNLHQNILCMFRKVFCQTSLCYMNKPLKIFIMAL